MGKLKILVVDDKKVIGDLFDFTLGFGGHAITFADNAKSAVDAIKDKNFNIVFLDIIMPEKDGIETLKEIKTLSPNLPIVMMSGYSIEEKKVNAKQLGAVGCLKKPFEIDDVKKIIKLATGQDI